jgi:hypothetical protein
VLATAHTWNGGDGPFNVVPLVGLLLSLVLIRTIFQSRIGLGAIGISAALGALFATLGGRFGFTVTAAIWIVAFALVAAIARAGQGPLPRNPSD